MGLWRRFKARRKRKKEGELEKYAHLTPEEREEIHEMGVERYSPRAAHVDEDAKFFEPD
jgi:hypothetical protein